jgi:hypothetical protein
MPAAAQWFLRLPEIITELERLKVPVIDRTIFESVFRVRRRRAIQLMHAFGGYQVGKTFIVERAAILGELAARRESEAFDRERRRKMRLAEELERVRRLVPGRKVRIAADPDVHERVIGDLPGGIHLRPGELRIEFFGPEDLLRHLFELSQAIINDYERFEALVEDGRWSMASGSSTARQPSGAYEQRGEGKTRNSPRD